MKVANRGMLSCNWRLATEVGCIGVEWLGRINNALHKV